MRTKNGMTIEVTTEVDSGSMTCGIDDMGEGWMKLFLCAEDATDLLESTLRKSQWFKPEWQNKVLSLCLKYTMDHGYTIRKAGC